MRGDTDALSAERDRIESELAQLNERQVALDKERAETTRKTEAAAGDTEILAQLKIEAEQAAEAKRMNDRLIAQTAKRLVEVRKVIAMQEQSDIT